MAKTQSRRRSYTSGREFQARGVLNIDAMDAAAREAFKPSTTSLNDDLGADLRGVRVVSGVDTTDSLVVGPAQTSGYIRSDVLRTVVPGVIRALTAPRKIDTLLGITVVGSWDDEEIVWKTAESAGKPELYGDYTNIPLASYKQGEETRGVVRFELGFGVGNLEVARQQRNGYNAAEEKRQAVIEALEITRNSVGFFGIDMPGVPVYGLLNDPGLLPYDTAAAAWGTTPAAQQFGVITAAFTRAFGALEIQSAGRIDDSTKLTAALPLGFRQFMGVSDPSARGRTVAEWLKEQYPNLRLEFVPEFREAVGGQNIMYLYADSVQADDTGTKTTIEQLVPQRYRALGTEQRIKTMVEDAANALSGVVVTRPWAVYRVVGI